MTTLISNGVYSFQTNTSLNYKLSDILVMKNDTSQRLNFLSEDDAVNVSTSDYYFGDEDYLLSDVDVFTVWLFIVLSAIVLVLGLSGNCLVWFAVWRNPRMRSATNTFLVNLAVADFLVTLVCLPPTMAEDITGIWHLGQEMCKVVKCLQKISVLVSVLTLTAISLERWMAICRPLMFRQTSLRAKRAIVIVWALSLASAVPDAISLDLLPVSQDPTEVDRYCGPTWSHDMETIHLWIMFVVFYVVPLCIMTFTYIKVAQCLWQSGLGDENDEASANVPRAQIMLRRKKAKMLIVVVAMFAVCYLPIYVFFLLRYTGVLDLFPNESIKPFILSSHWLCYFNSAINPAIYNFMSCNFRREFRIACRICCRKGSMDSAIHEVRLRSFHKHRFRCNHRSGGLCLSENSCTLQTQITVLSAATSSYSSLAPSRHAGSPSPTKPALRAGHGKCVCGEILEVNGGITPRGRRPPPGRQRIRFLTLQKNHRNDASYS